MITFQRVSPEHMKKSFHNLHNTITKLHAFVHFIANIARNVFQRINLALENLMEFVVLEDFEFLIQNLSWSAPRYGFAIDRIQKLLREIISVLPAIVNETDSTKIETVCQSMKGYVNHLIASFDMLSFMNSHPGSSDNNDVPSRLVSDQTRLDECQTFQTNITNILENRVLNNQSCGMLDRLKSITLTDSDINRLYVMYKMYMANKCVSELPIKLEYFVRTIDEIRLFITRVMRSTPGFDNDLYLINERHHLHKLETTAAWLANQLKTYSENRTTKIGLSTGTVQPRLSDVELTLDRILYAVEKNNINPLLSATNTILRDIVSWYSQSLNAVTALIAFNEDSDIEDKTRTLIIWRHPLAKLETKDVLQFKHTASESWRSWDLSTNQQEFIFNGKATAMISTIIGEYRQVLQSELTQIWLECKRAMEDVTGSIKDVVDDFRNIHKEGLLGRDFVL